MTYPRQSRRRRPVYFSSHRRMTGRYRPYCRQDNRRGPSPTDRCRSRYGSRRGRAPALAAGTGGPSFQRSAPGIFGGSQNDGSKLRRFIVFRTDGALRGGLLLRHRFAGQHAGQIHAVVARHQHNNQQYNAALPARQTEAAAPPPPPNGEPDCPRRSSTLSLSRRPCQRISTSFPVMYQ